MDIHQYSFTLYIKMPAFRDKEFLLDGCVLTFAPFCFLITCRHGCYRGSPESVHQFERARTAARNETGHQKENDPEDKELRQQTVHQDTVRHVDDGLVLTISDANICSEGMFQRHQNSESFANNNYAIVKLTVAVRV
jgi:hypothetical protein